MEQGKTPGQMPTPDCDSDIVSISTDTNSYSKQDNADRDQLARLGKTSVLRRNFSLFSILGLACTVLITWEASLALFSQGLANGGPAGLVYSFIIVWMGNLSVFTALSELASMAPTSGGQYHWVAMLAPRWCSKFVSYVTGWLTIGGWVGNSASACLVMGSYIQGLAVLTVDGFQPQAYQATLLFWAVALMLAMFNTVLASWLPSFERMFLVLHISGFFAMLIPLVIKAPHGTPHDVFETFQNQGMWPSQGLSFFVGMIGNAFSFAGSDAAYHMSEEVRNPSLVVPQSVCISILINGTAGLAMMIGMLFCIGDVERVTNSKTGFPVMEIFLQATKSVPATAAMASIIFVLLFCATVGLFTSTSRLVWSFSRDHGLPFWRTLSSVNAKTKVPYWAVFATTALPCLLALINLGSHAAINALLSLSISSLYASYLAAASLLLYRRCTKTFKTSDGTDMPELANTTGGELVWGPWHIPGVLGVVNNAFACVYLIVILFFSFWPPGVNPTPDDMNWSILVTGCVVIFSVLYYMAWGRREYHGPVVET